MSLCDVKEFKYENVIKHCNTIAEKEDQIKYLHCVLYEWNNNRPELDPNGEMVPNFEEKIKNDIEIRKKLIECEGTGRTEKDLQNINENIVKITGKTGLIDITRIFDSMVQSGIISSKTEASKIARIFFTEPFEKDKFARKLTANRNDIEKSEHNSNSKELIEFTKILIEKSFNKKENVLRQLDSHINKLLENLI